MEKQYMVISHTHWDREWYQPFEQFRLRLVQLIDNLLAILEEYPEYIFHLDAQTVVLEDYLEIRPQNEEILRRYITAGNILVGPWYVQNDFYLTSGEATVRNLMIGRRLAKRFGACGDVGYTPDQFGVMGQLPQILRDFGIDSCIFGRGYTCFLWWDVEAETYRKALPPSEFFWEGADGSRVLGIHMPYWYNNCQRLSSDEERAWKLLEKIDASFEGVATTPYLLLMNGVDHLEAQEDLLPILQKLNARLPEDSEIRQGTMRQYVDAVKHFHHLGDGLDGDQLSIFRGELRNGGDGNLLQNTLSSHIYLKALNTNAQNMLENRLEPLYACMALQGAPALYPQDFFEYLWKLLLHNHPHDSICGCSHDHVHTLMESRFERFFDLADDLLDRGLAFVANHIDRTGIQKGDYILPVCNFSEGEHSGVVEVVVEIPQEDDTGRFTIRDHRGQPVEFAVMAAQARYRNFFSPINLPGATMVNAYTLRLYTGALPPYSIQAFILHPEQGEALSVMEERAATTGVLENDCLRVDILENGRIDLLDKVTGEVFEDVLWLEDTEDTGDAYVFRAGGQPAITSRGVRVEMHIEMDTPFCQSCRLTYHMPLPESFDTARQRRSDTLVDNRVEVEFSLCRDARRVELAILVDNRSKDHRLRLMVRTGVPGFFTDASAPFDVVRRDMRNRMDGYHNGDHPNSGFVDVAGATRSFAVLTDGIYEFQHIDEKGTLAFTLMRAVRGFGTYVFDNQQVLRPVRLRLALMPHRGNYVEAGLAIAQKQFQCGLTAGAYPADTRRFAGGRPAVQDSDIQEIFFREDPYASLVFAGQERYCEVLGDGIAVTACKLAQDGNAVVLRLYNTANTPGRAVVRFPGREKTVWICSMEETRREVAAADADGYHFFLRPKQILTLAFT